MDMKTYGLVADAGGTNVRFALVDLDEDADMTLLAPRKYPSKSFASIEDAARKYFAERELDVPPDSAVLSVAGPVHDNSICMTNLGWRFSGDDFGKALKVSDVRLINDYEAIAYSVDLLGGEDVRDIGSARVVPRQDRETVAIVGPGTGLGVGGYVRAQGHLIPLVTEGGHVDFAPADDIEANILKVLRIRFGHVSAERILSGPGLSNLYDAMSAISGTANEALTPHEITRQALADGKSLCAQVLTRFCAILGSFAGDVALTLGARHGVLLAGGILPAIDNFFAASPFRARFEAKGRFESYMRDIPTHLILQDNAGLLGAAFLLRARGTQAMTHK